MTFPAAEIAVDFMDPADTYGSSLFPTGNLIDTLDVPGLGALPVTFINAGIPTIFLNAEDLGYRGTELQDDINGSEDALKSFENIRAHGAMAMGPELMNRGHRILRRDRLVYFSRPKKRIPPTCSGRGGDHPIEQGVSCLSPCFQVPRVGGVSRVMELQSANDARQRSHARQPSRGTGGSQQDVGDVW